MSFEAAAGRISALEAWIAGKATSPESAPPTAPTESSTAFSAAMTAATTAAGGTPAAAGAGTSATVPFNAEIEAAAAKHGIDPALLKGLVRQESNFDPNAGSPAGARGLTQLMPGTAASLGVTDVTDPVQALDGGAKYLRQQLDAFGGDVTKALAAYNAGPGAVQRFGGVPPYAETQNYVRKVQEFAAQYRAGGSAAPVPGAGAVPAAGAAPAGSLPPSALFSTARPLL